MMTLNNENPFKTTAKTSSSSPHLEFTILLYKYGLPYLPTYHKKFSSNFFLEKVWLEDTLLTYNLDICPKFLFFFNPLLSDGVPTILETNQFILVWFNLDNISIDGLGKLSNC